MHLPDAYGCETQRLNLIVERYGLEEAISFAKRTIVAYRRVVLYKQILPDKSHLFVESYLAFKRFIRDYGDIVTDSPGFS